MDNAKILEILASYNRFWTTGTIDAGIERDALAQCLDQLESKEVVVLKGVRRCGKSTLMAQVIRHLLSTGTEPTAILRVNLEEPLFATEYSVDLLERIYRTYREQVRPEGRCWLFLDELQNVPDWESWVRARNETEDIKIFITGSSATMLSREIGTKLTGRQISFEIYPLSFREFLSFNDIAVATELDYLERKTAIRKLFGDYLRYGGFPEVVLRPQPQDKELLLKNYFEDILYRDVAARNQVRDIGSLRNLAVYLLTNAARPTSINKLKNNFTISQEKTENYVSALLESYLLFQLQKFSFSVKKTMRAGFKPYAIDTGLRNRVAFSFSQDTGWLVENVLFRHLLQQHEEIYFHNDDGEADFVVKEGMQITRAVQVWYEDAAVRQIPPRELACFNAHDTPLAKAERLLITNDHEGEIATPGGAVRAVSAARFLLFDSR